METLKFADSIPWASYLPLPSEESPFPLQEYRVCPISGSKREEELLRIENFQFYNDMGGKNRILHRVVRNLDSGLIYSNPRFTPYGFSMLFEKAGRSYIGADKHSTNQQRVEWLKKHCHDAACIMDVGCGNGEFLREVPSEWRRIGVDVDISLIEAARKRNPDITFICQDLASYNSEEKADVITMIQVLEHLIDPIATLKRLREIASPDRRLFVEVPVIDWLYEWPERDTIACFFTVIHLTHFSKNSVQVMLRHAGWEIIDYAEFRSWSSFAVLAQPGPVITQLPEEHEKEFDFNLASSYLAVWRNSIERINNSLSRIPPEKNILIWGAGLHTEHLAHCTNLFKEDRKYLIVDSDPLKIGATFHGIPILSPDDIPEKVWKNPYFQIIPSTSGHKKEVLEILAQKGVPSSAITPLYD